MRVLVLAAAVALLAVQPDVRAARQNPPAPAVDAPPPFDQWLENLIREAHERGYSDTLVDQTLTGLKPLPRVIQNDRAQAELVVGFDRYYRARINARFVQQGREMARLNSGLLSSVERKYEVQRRFVLAIWGIETRYGRVKGNTPVFQALATLAWEPRRSDFFRGELFDALTMVSRGHIDAASMTGSWAGAMGHPQFMPSSYLKYAEDFDGDGRTDIWQSTPDALASIANYLGKWGWDDEYTWGREVRRHAGRSRTHRKGNRAAHRRLLCDAQHDRAHPAHRLAAARRPASRRRRAADSRRQGGTRHHRPAHVSCVPELRRHPQIQLRALLRAHRRAARRSNALIQSIASGSGPQGSGLSQASAFFVFRISSIRNRSVSSARRWIDAFRLSTSCELMEGCASTSSMAARLSRASRSSTAAYSR